MPGFIAFGAGRLLGVDKDILPHAWHKKVWSTGE